MRYGLPYKGSKNAIANWIVDNPPQAEYFVDMFCGGGAVTHCAMLRDKWDKFVMNDIDKRLPILFKECAYGKHSVERHREWITREQFKAVRETDAYTALVWSFGNNGKDYLYGKNIEDFKHAYHVLVFDNNPEPISHFGYRVELLNSDCVLDRYYCYKKQIREQTEARDRTYGACPFELESTVRQIEIERLQSLQTFGLSYEKVQIPENSMIYCDIPYRGTNCGKYAGFDHERFYEWAEQQDNIFISEYEMPEQFIEIASKSKSVLSASNGNSGKAVEKLFTNKRTLRKRQYDLIFGS